MKEEYVNNIEACKTSSHMLRHLLQVHEEEEEDWDKIKFGMRIIRNTRTALKRHRSARWVLPYQARFKTCTCLISNSSKNQEFIQTTSQFQARSENLKSKNLNFKQDSRI